MIELARRRARRRALARPPRGEPRRAPGTLGNDALDELRAACPELPTLDEALAFFAEEAARRACTSISSRRRAARPSSARSTASGSLSGAS